VKMLYGLYVTRDLGRTWEHATEVGTEVLGLACRGREVAVGGRSRALLVSHDLGAHWTKEPLTDLFTAPSSVSVQATAFDDAGVLDVGFEGLYTDRRGSLFRRSP